MDLLNKLTIKNLKLNKKRTIVTIIGIMLSVALITAVASMYSSAIQSLINYETREKGNFHVAFFDVPTSEISTFKNNRKIESINLTQNIGYSKIDSQNEYKPYAYIKAFTSDSLKNLSIKLVEGRLPQNENEILIPTHLKTNGRVFLNVGDTISLDVGKRIESTGYELNQFNPLQKDEENNCNEQIIDTQKKEYKIVGIIERPATNIEQHSAPGYTFITYLDSNNLRGNVDLYTRYTKDGMKNVYEVTANILGVDAEKYERYLNPTGEMPDEDIIKFGAEVENKYKTNVNQYLIDLETDPISSSSVGGLGIVVGIVVGIIVFTSVFCIKNSFDISITEKTKQYGMLRSIGATKKQIIKENEYEKLSDIDCIIILGAGIWGDKPSPMLEDRLLEGIKLYQNNVSNKIIMSGDHGRKEYNEVKIMKEYAIEKGIPSENIFMDHAGFSTYDSIYRAKDIFQAKKVIIVTQKYHLYRALYIANKLGLEAYGVGADPRKYVGATYRETREILARDKDFVKCIFKPNPTYLGDTIPVSGNGDVTNDGKQDI